MNAVAARTPGAPPVRNDGAKRAEHVTGAAITDGRRTANGGRRRRGQAPDRVGGDQFANEPKSGFSAAK
jgi:hypothetical protein